MRKQPDKNSSFTPCADIKICGILIFIYYLYACVRSRAGSRQEICPAADGKTEKIGSFCMMEELLHILEKMPACRWKISPL